MRDNLRDVTALIARIVVGVTFMAHAYQKLVLDGMSATAQGFEEMGIPLATVAAWFVMVVELLGGLALVLGVALPVVGVLLAIVMLGALFIGHASDGFFVAEGGFEYVLVLAGVSLALGFGGGRFALDSTFGRGSASSAGEGGASARP